MKAHTFRNRYKKYHSKRSSALLIVLAMVMIISTLVLAFLFRTSSNLQAETSRSHHVSADVVADSAASYTKGLFMSEIGAHSTLQTVGGIPAYKPTAATSMLPTRAFSSSISSTDTNYFNLIRQSVTDNHADTNASSDATDVVSQNGRSIGISTWNLPLLIPNGGFTGNTQLPHWIYLSQTNGVSSASTGVVGRFAYNVYDIGGLLDINAAGHPAGMTSQQLAMMGDSEASADLAQVPGFTANDVGYLIAFRNPQTTTIDKYTNYVSAAVAAGFLSPIVTNASDGSTLYNNYFSGRQDFIRYARNCAVTNADFSNAAPYFTTFSRTLNAPSWGPTADVAASPYNYATSSTTSGSTNRFTPFVTFSSSHTITHYNDNGTTSNYTVQKGTPLLQRRFSLAKLGWLNYDGTTRSGISTTAVQTCFGLVWSSTYDNWEYCGPTSNGSAIQSTIETLDQVAAEGREPNFFELLKAGILSGSIGQATKNDSNGTSLTGNAGVQAGLEQQTDLQILKIGADILDCTTSNDCPTVLALNAPVKTSSSGTVTSMIEVTGTKGLPYLSAMDLDQVDQVTGTQVTTNNGVVSTNYTFGKYDALMSPIFFNPHRKVTTGGTSTNTPASVQIVMQGKLYEFYYPSPSTPSPFFPLPQIDLSNTGSFPVITYPLTGSGVPDFQTTPNHYHQSGALSLASQVTWLPPGSANSDIAVYKLYAFEDHPVQPPKSTLSKFSCYINNLAISLQYKFASGIYKTYSTFTGPPLITTGGFGNILVSKMGTVNYANQSNNIGSTAVTGQDTYTLWDPRTSRLGPSWAVWRPGLDAPPLKSPNSVGANGGSPSYVWLNDPFPLDGSIIYGEWPVGGKSAYLSMADPDGTYRPADGWLDASGATTNPYGTVGSGSTVSATTSAARPVILYRPYTSVAELGYVFRDSPWRTLSFFDSTSGDAGLLDLFSVSDQPSTVAGQVSLDTRQPWVLTALFNNVGQEPDGSSPFSATTAASLAATFSSYAFSSGSPTTTLPQNKADLATFLGTLPVGGNLDAVKYHREAVVRALADTTQTRTWNLLIDIVAQSGQYPPTVTDANASGANFIVQGETHRWISVAIDRYTGQVIDQQVETVNQ